MSNQGDNIYSLLPCPFCGGEGHLTEFCGDWRVICIECNASVDDYFEGDNPRQEAINAWNKRYKEDDDG